MKRLLKYLGMAAISGAILGGCGGGSSGALAPCAAVTWQAGVNYPLGTVVLYAPNGLYYKLVQVAGNGSDGTTPDHQHLVLGADHLRAAGGEKNRRRLLPELDALPDPHP